LHIDNIKDLDKFCPEVVWWGNGSF